MGFFNMQNRLPKRSGGFSNYWKLNLKGDIGQDTPCYFAVLHDLTPLWKTSEDSKDNGNLHIHFVKGQPKAPLCNHLYYDEGDPDSFCEHCEGTNSFGNQNYPIPVKPLLVYVYNLKDQKKTSKDGTKEFDVNPIKIFEVPAGKDRINFEEIEEAHNNNYLSIFDEPDSVFCTKKLSKGIDKPSIMSSQKLKQMGKQFSLDLPEEVLKLKDLPAAELRGILLDAYGNVKRDDPTIKELDIQWPVAKETKPEEDKDDDSEADDADN